MTDAFYPQSSRNPHFRPIRIVGAPAYRVEVMRILQHVHIGARSRAGAYIVSSILLNPDPREQVTVRERHVRANDALTTPVGGGPHHSEQPRSTLQDFLANPSRGAGASIAYHPDDFAPIRAGAPGAARDEGLLHELVHAFMMQRGISSTRDVTGFNFAIRVWGFEKVDEFYAVMITNVYASECGRGPRQDHRGNRPLLRNAISIAADPRFQPFFRALRSHAPALDHELRQINTAFNPWNPPIDQPVDGTTAFNDP